MQRTKSHARGAADGPFPANIDVSDLDGHNGFALTGSAYSHAGISVSLAGDLDGDGLNDIIVGAFYDLSGTGAAYVVYGKAGVIPAGTALDSLNGTNGFKLQGSASEYLGGAVSTIGDLNGDGFDDEIIGANNRAYIVFGTDDAFSASQSISSLADGTHGVLLTFNESGVGFGASASSAGDINGDGLSDLIVGAPYTGAGGEVGSAYVVFGKPDGWSAAEDISALDGHDGFALLGRKLGYAGVSVSSAGDVNGDGFADLIVGADLSSANGNRSGAAYVVFGHKTHFHATVKLAGLDGQDGFQVPGAHRATMPVPPSAAAATSTATVMTTCWSARPVPARMATDPARRLCCSATPAASIRPRISRRSTAPMGSSSAARTVSN